MEMLKGNDENNLAEEEALLRASQVSKVAYTMHMHCWHRVDFYAVDYVADFWLVKERLGNAPLFLDFISRRIDSLTVNGVAVDLSKNEAGGVHFISNRLHLPAALLRDGANKLEMRYVNQFAHTGAGFHRVRLLGAISACSHAFLQQFVDPDDGAEYHYTNFEPFE